LIFFFLEAVDGGEPTSNIVDVYDDDDYSGRKSILILDEDGNQLQDLPNNASIPECSNSTVCRFKAK
jgi:hypothetical protein